MRTRETQYVCELIACGVQSLEIIFDFLLGYKESVEFPFDAHIEDTLYTIDILIEINDVTTVGCDKVCQNGEDAGRVGTVHAQHCGVSTLLFHKLLL